MLVIDWQQFLDGKTCTDGLSKTAMTIGVFDGVHRGHQALIERVVSHNADLKSEDLKSGDLKSGDIKSVHFTPAVITFRENYKSTETSGNIQTFEQKLEVFEQLGIKTAIVIDFSESFQRMKGIEFLEILIKHGNIGFFAVGESFRCGYQLDTDAQAIREFFASRGVQVEIVPEVTEGLKPISSSRIRAAIANGDHQLAQKMLGRVLSVSGN